MLAQAEEEAERLAPPAERPELSPAEVVARLERLEAQKSGPDGVRRDSQIEGRYRRKEALRLVRVRKAVAEQDARDQKYQKRIRPRVEKLEGEVSAIDAEMAAEEGRHAEAMAQLRARRSDATDKISGLVKTLGSDETIEDRLQPVRA